MKLTEENLDWMDCRPLNRDLTMQVEADLAERVAASQAKRVSKERPKPAKACTQTPTSTPP